MAPAFYRDISAIAGIVMLSGSWQISAWCINMPAIFDALTHSVTSIIAVMLRLVWTVEHSFKWAGPGRSWIAGPAGISRLGPNSEPRGNNRSFPETRERDRVPVKKIVSRDSIFGLVNSTYSFEITNHNQLVSNIKYLANFIKKYWTYFRYQKLADFLVCLPPSVRV